ncbi:hypothetical protein GUJ93_ZPchr0012g19343 [Zizania palustris]|uniref:Uncharacterized protein n=1 Tax=Zizania palustris TaxID=103762 RepID=A0A8J5WTH8_ZIZPA|nr:hypothetical protein GUJ93_ZPchr0012g19343 [Zizania palustris]
MVASAILPDLATEVLIPAAAVVGIAFAVVQWVLQRVPHRGGGGSQRAQRRRVTDLAAPSSSSSPIFVACNPSDVTPSCVTRRQVRRDPERHLRRSNLFPFH